MHRWKEHFTPEEVERILGSEGPQGGLTGQDSGSVFLPEMQTELKSSPVTQGDANHPHEVPQVIFIPPPDGALLDGFYEERKKADGATRRYIRQFALQPAASQEHIALTDFMHVLYARRRAEELRMEAGKNGHEASALAGKADKQAELLTERQMAHGRHFQRIAGTAENPYNMAILRLVTLTARLTHAERDIVRFPYIGMMGNDFSGTESNAERKLRPDLPTDVQISSLAFVRAAQRMDHHYRKFAGTSQKTA